MMEGAVMEYVKWFIGIVSTVFTVMLVILMFRLNEINTFQQEVNYQIERNGGITTEVKKTLNDYAMKEYNGYASFTTSHNDGDVGIHTFGPLKDDDGKVVHDRNGNTVTVVVDKDGKAVPFSGFTVVELGEGVKVSKVVTENGVKKEVEKMRYPEIDRGTDQAKYGTPIKYALIRDVGEIDFGPVGSFSFEPVVAGEAASRVRGTGNFGRQK